MIGLEHRQVGALGVEVLSLGPVAEGLIVRGVWLCPTAAVSTFAHLALAVCRAPVVVLDDVLAGRQLVNTSDTVQVALGVPALSFNLAAGMGQGTVVPVYEFVSSGPIYIGVAAFSTAAFQLACGLVVDAGVRVEEPEARSAMRRIERREADVMKSLRRTAEFARG